MRTTPLLLAVATAFLTPGPIGCEPGIPPDARAPGEDGLRASPPLRLRAVPARDMIAVGDAIVVATDDGIWRLDQLDVVDSTAATLLDDRPAIWLATDSAGEMFAVGDGVLFRVGGEELSRDINPQAIAAYDGRALLAEVEIGADARDAVGTVRFAGSTPLQRTGFIQGPLVIADGGALYGALDPTESRRARIERVALDGTGVTVLSDGVPGASSVSALAADDDGVTFCAGQGRALLVDTDGAGVTTVQLQRATERTFCVDALRFGGFAFAGIATLSSDGAGTGALVAARVGGGTARAIAELPPVVRLARVDDVIYLLVEEDGVRSLFRTEITGVDGDAGSRAAPDR